jgi:ubiquinone/menaquinone biosynthesis C-methylase UbiE
MSSNFKTAHDAKTIKDFSSQWMEFPDNEGYFISLDLLQDSLAGLIKIEDFRNKRVLDLGSGTGRIIRWLFLGGGRTCICC